MQSIFIKKQSSLKSISIPLAASKSESNRVLIMNKLAGDISNLNNLSSARDTQIMKSLLDSEHKIYDVKDAGTVMRFMTAYLSLVGKNVTITGSERMCQRPIGLLIDALGKLGADIQYLVEVGYPPMQINKLSAQKTNELSIQGNVSSQYISALLMIAPCLPNGLKIKLIGEVYSLPYIQMTLNLMNHFGIEYTFEGAEILIDKQDYISNEYTVESDWSGASYWYSFVALSDNVKMKLLGLKNNSLQGDQAIVEIMEKMGVKSTFETDGVVIEKKTAIEHFEYNFKHCPDLAQTVMVVAAAKGIKLEMTGLESLKIKETDRVAAMANELNKIGVKLEELSEDKWIIDENSSLDSDQKVTFETYEDHRMAMALAPLCMLYNIEINEPEVVRKSYPEYWEHLELAGIKLNSES